MIDDLNIDGKVVFSDKVICAEDEHRLRDIVERALPADGR